MACTPYGLAAGQFTTSESFHTGPEANFQVRIKPGDATRYEILHMGTAIATVSRGTYDDVLSWNLFPGAKFLSVQLVRDPGTGVLDFRLDVWNVTTTSSPLNVTPITGLLSGSQGPQLHCDPSTDGKAYHLWLGEGPNQSKNHKVFRSDNGALLCEGLASSEKGQRLVEHAGGNIRIFLGSPAGTTLGTCPLPGGSLTVPDGCQTFPEVVIGGPPGTPTTSTLTYKLRNDGKDCLTISAIGNSPPFGVLSPMTSLPVTLAPAESMTVVVQFAPASVGSTGDVHLPITRSPPAGDDDLCARGTARAPVASLRFTSTALGFGSQPVGSSAGGTLTIANDGELPINIEVPAPPGGSPYSWATIPAGTSLAGGASQIVNVTFTPLAEGPASGTLRVLSSLPTSPHTFALGGSGCVPNGALALPLAPFPGFGDVEVGYRSVRFVTVTNTGDGDATLRARVDLGVTGFGLADSSGSITSAEGQRTWTVLPAARCGPGTTGTGKVVVAVNFWATGAPGVRSGTLTLEHMSGTTTLSSRTYALTANVVPAVALDLAAALDRSGSMTDLACARQKSRAAIESGQLLVQLMRPEVDDRIATVRFNHFPDVLQPLAAVSDTSAPTQDVIAGGLNASNLNPGGFTCIAGGAMVALAELQTPHPASPPNLRKVLVTLTDGVDNTAYQDPATGRWYSVMGGRSRIRPDPGSIIPWFGLAQVDTDPLPWPSNVKGYAVGIGAEEDIDRGQLAALSTGTGGFYQVVTCMDGSAYFQLEKYFLEIFMDAVDMSSIADPVRVIAPGQVHRFEFVLARGDVGGLVTILDRDGIRLPARVLSPGGEELTWTSAPSGFHVRAGVAPTARFLEFKVPQTEPDRYAGRWVVEISHPGAVVLRATDEHAITHQSRPHSEPVMYGVAIGTRSNLRIHPSFTPDRVRVGERILLSAVLSEADWPVTGAAVSIEAVTPSGHRSVVKLHDDGAHDDGEPDDGHYAAWFGTSEGGSYIFVLSAECRTRDGEPVRREKTVGSYVEGRVSLDPSPSRGEDGSAILEWCCRRLTGWLPVLGIGLAIIIVLLLLAILTR